MLTGYDGIGALAASHNSALGHSMGFQPQVKQCSLIAMKTGQIDQTSFFSWRVVAQIMALTM